MAYDSIYTRINWENEKNTPLGATNLNKMDYVLSEIDKRVVNLSTTKAEQETVLNLVSDWQMNEETGIITVTKVNGEKIVFDLNVEKIPVSFGMSEDGILSMTTEDGSVFTANIGDMIPIMTFNSSDSINVTVSEDENGKVYTFEVKDGSITEEKLNPNYLANLKVSSETAKENADIAIENANSAIDSAESAKQYRDEAEQFRNETEAIVGVDVSQINSDITLNRQTLGYTKKNLLKNTATSRTINSVTFTVNEDKSVKVVGTNTATIGIAYDIPVSLINGVTYIANGISGGSYSDGCTVHFQNALGNSTQAGHISDGEKEFTKDDSNYDVQIYRIRVAPGATVDATIYPMIRLASITDPTYEPYVDDVDTRLKSLESGSGGSGGGTGTTDYEDLNNKPSINGVELSGNKTTADLGITNATQSADGLMSKEDKKLSDRVFKRLAPNIQIPANADLNTIEYLKIGTYGCVSANNAATLINCPTTNAFTMEVFNPYGGTYDNESTAPWVYRTRKIITGDGTTHYQLVRSGNTPGEFTYGDWNHNYSSNNKPTASDVGADASGSAAQALIDAKAYTDEKVPTKISQLENDGKFAEFDEYGNLTLPGTLTANEGIYSNGGIYENDEFGGNAVVKTKDELSALTAEGYMPDALLVKELHQRMGGYSFYNNPYVVYEVSTSSPFLLNGEYILSDSDTGYTYVGEYTEVYYSEIIEGDFKRRAGADTVSPFNLAKESIVVNKTDGTTATYTITKNCLLIVQSFEQNETSAFNSTIPTVDENITLIELSKNVVGRGGYYSGVAVYQALVNGSGNVSLTKNRTALYIIL